MDFENQRVREFADIAETFLRLGAFAPRNLGLPASDPRLADGRGYTSYKRNGQQRSRRDRHTISANEFFGAIRKRSLHGSYWQAL
jgi:hypothetical protein